MRIQHDHSTTAWYDEESTREVLLVKTSPFRAEIRVRDIQGVNNQELDSWPMAKDELRTDAGIESLQIRLLTSVHLDLAREVARDLATLYPSIARDPDAAD